MKRLLVAVVLASSAAATVAAQAPAATRAADVPRTKDGKPDFTGIWQVVNTASLDIGPHQARKGVPADAGVVVGDEIPY